LSTAAQPNITSVGTLTSLTVSGNVSGGNLNTAGKVVASTLESNVATGTAPFTVASTTQVANLNVATAGVAGTVTTAAQPNITSVGTLTSLGVSGAVTASTLVSNIATGTAPLTVTSTTQVANLNVATAGVAGTVTTAAQPNITSVGTLTSVAVTGNVTAGNVYANSGTIKASSFVGDGTSVGNVTAAYVQTDTANANVIGTFYPLFSNATSGVVSLDNFGPTIEFNPLGSILSFGQANVEIVTNGGGETMNLDGNNNKVRFTVSGAANALSIANTAVTSTLPLQLATYASNVARDTAITSPTAGMMIFVTGSGMQVRGATQWNLIAGSGT
jgi:hypothetical protein